MRLDDLHAEILDSPIQDVHLLYKLDKLIAVAKAAEEFVKYDLYNFPDDVDQCQINNLILALERMKNL